MRVRVYASALLLAWSGAVIVGQTQKVTTPEQLDKVMKQVQQANGAMQKAFKAKAYDDVRKNLAAAKEAVLVSQSFWIEHKKDDAVKLNKDTLAKMEALETIVAGETVDQPAAEAALKEVGASCRACHQQYRATDAENNFILKPGMIGG
jgi:cytochrome c556